MVESIVNIFINLLADFKNIPYGREIIIFIISCMPILELRGGLIAAALLGLNIVPSFIICFIGNLLPLPFILWFISPVFDWLKKKPIFKKKIEKMEQKAMLKKDTIEKYQFWGLLFFVGIPLPGTGGWTGTLIASMIGMNKKKAFVACIFGVLLAGIIVGTLSFGLLGKLI